jgi:hypothetical protein
MWSAVLYAATLAASSPAARASEPEPSLTGYQWSVRVEPAQGTPFEALLWVPPQADRIRGVLMGERAYIADDPAIRAVAAAEKLAVILLRPHFDAVFTYWEKPSAEILQQTLDSVAAASGYHEIRYAPLFPFGHSVSSVYSSRVAYWNPGRCFGFLAFKGALVEPHAPDVSVAGVPALVISGQFEEFGPGPSGVLREGEDRETGWRVSRERYLAMRARDERNLICFAVDGGSTHMAWSQRNAALTAVFLRKAAALRIPDWPIDTQEPVRCKEIDPVRGWLSETGIEEIPARMKAAAAARWTGDPRAAWWHADEEMATAWVKFHEGRFGKRAQFVAFKDPASGKLLRPRNDMRLVLSPHWVGADTFQVAADFLMEVCDKYPASAEPIGHADGPIRFATHRSGGIEQTGPDTFRVVRYGEKSAEGHPLAYHEGDAEYRHAEQPAFMKIALLTKGEANTITFPNPDDLRANGRPVTLGATSSSGLPVTYAVDYGPAFIADGRLHPLPLPSRVAQPMEIKVTAYQWGSAVEPFVQTAPPASVRLNLVP